MEINRDNYREFNAVNYSTLSTLAFEPSMVKHEKKESGAMSFGSLFDCLLTDPDRFSDTYIVADVKKPTAQLGEFMDIFFACPEEDLDAKYEYAYKEMKNRNPKLRDAKEKFIERMDTEAKPYLEFIEKSKDKIIVSGDDFYLATRMKDALKNNQFTEKYFNMSFDWETQWQTPMLAEICGIQFKGLLDMLLINHAKKEIIPIDIKTTSEYPNNFQRSIVKWNYLIQASLYWDIVQENYKDYKIHDFLFLVSSKVLPDKPYIWKADMPARYIGRYGMNRNGYNLKGYEQLASDLKWHEETGLWEYPRSVYENQGINEINFYL